MVDGAILGTWCWSLLLADLTLISSFNLVEEHVNPSVASVSATMATLFMSVLRKVIGERG